MLRRRQHLAGLAPGVILRLGQVFVEVFQVLWEFDGFQQVFI